MSDYQRHDVECPIHRDIVSNDHGRLKRQACSFATSSRLAVLWRAWAEPSWKGSAEIA